MDFTLLYNPTQSNYVTLVKDSSTVIRPGTFVALDGTNLAVEADATSAKIAYSVDGADAGLEEVRVIADKELLLKGKADAVFADTNKGIKCDIVVNGGKQEIDLGASATNVLRVDISKNAGTVGSDEDVLVRVSSHLLD